MKSNNNKKPLKVEKSLKKTHISACGVTTLKGTRCIKEKLFGLNTCATHDPSCFCGKENFKGELCKARKGKCKTHDNYVSEKKSDIVCLGSYSNGEECINKALRGSYYCGIHNKEELGLICGSTHTASKKGCKSKVVPGETRCRVHLQYHLDEKKGKEKETKEKHCFESSNDEFSD
ncbi:hypothetical protein DICPUDRAFT_80739 [Dictyostelium purpureum]|uniref:Uncharacterized protein n=1 Tax=Dictyostelium purpureum TaxID=5786 RepID=F0ZRD7_DICPU|nr:uncharacterized protein DICPUDRAFT_80739 [Dictyostelium purpureum]EGC33509.1 hypothetical protein DICPUDRAFT_80739 [Dictyostelium purpureum]|eukprot:XP_003289983.1 hypothetical protein DICPUDRAFT_80739 [Dictyostelium purpureum]